MCPERRRLHRKDRDLRHKHTHTTLRMRFDLFVCFCFWREVMMSLISAGSFWLDGDEKNLTRASGRKPLFCSKVFKKKCERRLN